MKSLYGTINISKRIKESSLEEIFKYYKIKKINNNRSNNDYNYGLEIIKSNSQNVERLLITRINNLTYNEEVIESILNNLVLNEVTTNIEDVVEDLLIIYSKD